ncbi:ATP-binding protein [Winogradskyella litorisediminis]|uniref:histidine kinase n=1 Tax=Winogradskyella litorisediminis TaxID=1156618 RepID=A0ABW3N3L1_9FLAO
MKIIRYTLLFTLFCIISINAQSSIEFQQLIGKNTPTPSITYGIESDSIGNIWIASEEGVLKHNSKSYVTYNSYRGLPSILNNRIKEIFVDSKQRVWIGSEKGVGLYNKDFDRFDYVQSTSELNPSLVEVIIEDEEKNIWVGAYNGLWKYDNETKKLHRKLEGHNIEALASINRKIVFGTSKGAFIFNTDRSLDEINADIKNVRSIVNIDDVLFIGTKSGELFKTDLTASSATQIQFNFDLSDAITDIIKDSDNTILLATDGEGIFRLNSEFKKIAHFTEDPNNPFSISSNGIYDIEYGKEDILWIATYGGGLNYLKSSDAIFENIRHKINNKNSLLANFTRSIAEDNKGNVWFGTKKGISVWNKSTNKWKHITNFGNNNDSDDAIVLAMTLRANYMWVGTYNKGLYKIDVDDLKPIRISKNSKADIIEKAYAVFKDSNGNIWAGGIEKGLTVFSKDNQVSTYPIQQIKSITELQNGDILAAGRRGVYRINHSKETFGLIENLIPDQSFLAYATINSVLQLSKNKLVLATNGEGLVFYNLETKEVKKITKENGMPSDVVQGVLLSDSNQIWASTTSGIVNLNIKGKDTIINVYDKKDGLASTEYNYGSFYKFKDGTLAFGGVDGVTSFNPKNIKMEGYKPNLVFETFKLSNELILPGKEPLNKHINLTDDINIEHYNNSFELEFAGVSQRLSSKLKYSWILDGFDEDWSKPGSNSIATYTNINPGNYTFKVKAINKYGVSSDVRDIQITVNAPWWATKKAYLIYVLLLIGLLYAIVHFTSVIIKKKNADEQIDFFNNITHEIKTPLTILISSLDNVTEDVSSGKDSKKRIKTTVKRINSLFEQMLNFQKVTTEDNLNLNITEIDVFASIQQRINNFKPLTEEHDITIEFNNTWNESLFFGKDNFDKIILNLLSNAIKYSHKGGTIQINTSKTANGEFKLEVIDNGIGIPKDQQKHILKRYFRARNVINSQRVGTGLGLMMVKKILEKTEGSISFTSQENKGTTFIVFIKNLKEDYNKSLVSAENTVAKNDIEAEPNQDELSELSDSKILIVEDNDELRDVLSRTLGNYFQVFEAKNGIEGLEMASTMFPNIIITDLIMPEMDGMQMAKKLKEDISLNHIPVFMLTVLQNSEQKLESIETGISEYLEKPVDIKYLLAKITNTLKWQNKLKKKFIHQGDVESAEIFRNKNDQDFLMQLEEKVIENIENENFSVHDLSGSFGMSRTSLYMKLKTLIDLSPQDFIIHTKLKRAKSLLVKGNLSIKEVAYRSGFSNPKYFSTSFKKFYGMTPSGFIDSLKKDK